MNTPTRITMVCDDPELRPRAEALAARLGLALDLAKPTGAELLLAMTGDHLELRWADPRAKETVRVDFAAGPLLYRLRCGGGRKQPLARAVGLKANRCPLVLDATAGLGRDGFILASLGCRVMMMERSPVLAALLEDGLERAARQAELAPIIARISVTTADCLALPPFTPAPDVIYLDPMYPHRSKSALVKKEMRLVRALVGEDSDASQLLDWALLHPGSRVVVKRPKGAEKLGSRPPSTVISSTNSRFDIYLPA
ncbi:MAG: class I SAM-dependent methyltransferase [Thermodesulfobacteriota bacterium]